MNWEKLKNFVIGGGFLVIGGMLLAYLEWRVSVNIDEALASLDIQTDSNIVSMKSDIHTNTLDIQVNTTDIGHNREYNERTQRQLEEVARILMQPPE